MRLACILHYVLGSGCIAVGSATAISLNSKASTHFTSLNNMSLLLSATPHILRQQFFALQTREEIASLLDITDYQLRYHLYIVRNPNKYVEFQIPKKSGGVRKISSPNTALKIIQQKLNQVLQSVYQPKAPVHSFLIDRSIVSNAKQHLQRKYVLNIDLEDFFPSVNFGRVRGLFMAEPYKRNSEVATILAQICCHNNQLPQGAPTSPIVSNMICAKLDSQLRKLAQRNRSTYTRYADDLTFSTSMPKFPLALAKTSDNTGQVEVGVDLEQIIQQNGFKINAQKLRLRTRHQRQEVTGLTTNKKVNVRRSYVRKIRAMLHAWKVYGTNAAARKFLDKYDSKGRTPVSEELFFKRVVKGKLEFLKMVRGEDDPIYRRFRDQLKQLAPELVKDPVVAPTDTGLSIPISIFTEGKTDWKHLKAALNYLQGLEQFKHLNITFKENLDEKKQGDSMLLTICEQYCKTTQKEVTIAVFDRDKPDIVKKVSDNQGPFKAWGNKVYSFALPIPNHRMSTPVLSIELYYKDEEIQRVDTEGRRLFLSNEFHPKSGKHLLNPELSISEVGRLKSSLKVLDNNIFNTNHSNIALPKNDFADNILNKIHNFDNFDFSEFEKIFKIVDTIIAQELSDNKMKNLL